MCVLEYETYNHYISVGQINVSACNLITTLCMCVFWFCLHRDYQNENQTGYYNFKS